MQQNPPTVNKKTLSKWWFLLWGFLAGLLVVILIGLVLLLARGTLRSLASVDTPNPAADARVELKVAADGCGVERGEVTGSTPVSSLTWVIVDEDGYTVLERNAEGENRYRYFAGGHYRVHVSAWYLDRYISISDEVEIDC